MHQYDDYFVDIAKGPFIDEPVKILKERYDEAIAFLVSRWSSLPNKPLAIYQIGQVAAPGISDLDFIIVFPSGNRIDWREYQPDTFPSWIRQMLTHPPYCCTEETWPELTAWYPTFNMRHLFGKILNEPLVPSELLSGCSMGMLVDYLLVKVPRDFIWLSWERPLRLRILLAMLHSLKYTLKLAETAGIPLNDKTQIICEVDDLRVSWFELDSEERLQTLAQLSEKVCSLTGELIQNVNEKIMAGLKGDLVAYPKPQEKLTLFSFDSSWTYESAISKSFNTYRQSGEIEWTNPESFLQVLGIYSDESPLFKKYFAKHGCNPQLSWDGGPWDKGLRYHARAMIRYSKSTSKLGVPSQKYIALGYYSQPNLLYSISRKTLSRIKHLMSASIA